MRVKVWISIFLTGAGLSVLNGQVRIEPRPDRQEVIYRVAAQNCDIQWTVYHSDVNRGVIQHRATCTLPLRQQAPLIRELLGSVIKDPQTAASLHTLSVGLLRAFPGMQERLAVLASGSPGWDSQSGRPKSGSINRIVRDLARQGRFFAEWQEAFAAFQRQIEVADIEEVAVAPARDLPFFSTIREHAIRPEAKLPYDCDIWLKVKNGGK